MTKEELAAILNGREIGDEITDHDAVNAKASMLLVIFGASDDLVELRGAIYDEINAFDGTDVYIANGKLVPDLDDETETEILEKHGVLEIVQKAHRDASKIEAVWCAEPIGPSWTFKTDLPHATFDIMEDDEVFCRGLVVQL